MPLSPLVQRALLWMHKGINVGDGFTYHRTDEDRVKDMLVRLHRAGEMLDPLEIEEWAARHSWHRGDVTRLGNLALAISQGKPQSFQPGWADNILDMIRAELAQEASA